MAQIAQRPNTEPLELDWLASPEAGAAGHMEPIFIKHRQAAKRPKEKGEEGGEAEEAPSQGKGENGGYRGTRG